MPEPPPAAPSRDELRLMIAALVERLDGDVTLSWSTLAYLDRFHELHIDYDAPAMTWRLRLTGRQTAEEMPDA